MCIVLLKILKHFDLFAQYTHICTLQNLIHFLYVHKSLIIIICLKNV